LHTTGRINPGPEFGRQEKSHDISLGSFLKICDHAEWRSGMNFTPPLLDLQNGQQRGQAFHISLGKIPGLFASELREFAFPWELKGD
jgi:hypothetical protein